MQLCGYEQALVVMAPHCSLLLDPCCPLYFGRTVYSRLPLPLRSFVLLHNNAVPADSRPRRKLILREVEDRRFSSTSRVKGTTVLPTFNADLGRIMSTNETVLDVRPRCRAGSRPGLADRHAPARDLVGELTGLRHPRLCNIRSVWTQFQRLLYLGLRDL